MTDSTQVLAPPSRGRNQEFWVGVFVIVGGLLTLYLLLTMTDAADFRGRYHVRAVVPDAGGIRKGDPVQMKGVNIGRVRQFVVEPGRGVMVRMEVEAEYKIPSDSRVELTSAGLLGGMVARVVPGDATTMAAPEQELGSVVPVGLEKQANEVVDEAKKTLGRVQALLSDNTVKGAEASVEELRGLLKRLTAISAEQQGELKGLTTSLKAAAGNVEKATSREEIDRVMKHLDDISAKADRTASALEASTKVFNTVLSRVERGEGTLGKMATDDALYANFNKTLESMNSTSKELKDLLADLKANPKKYLKVSVF